MYQKSVLLFFSLYTVFTFTTGSIHGQSDDTLQISTRQFERDFRNYQDSTNQRIRELEKTVEALQEMIRKEKQADEMQQLLDEADRLSTEQEEQKIDVSKKYFSGVRQQQGLNPNISFGVDFFGAFSSSDASSIGEPGDVSYGNNGFYLREAQVSFIAPLDPFTRGKGFISATPDGVVVDEAYMEWINLPLNANLKLGVYNAAFGFYNRYHDHALPQFDRPRVLVNLFGTGGLNGPGIASNFMLPPAIAHATTLDISMIYGQNSQSFMDAASGNGLIFSGQMLNYYDLSASSYLEVRLSGAGGKNYQPDGTFRSYIGSAGIAYKWAPMGREKYRTLEWKTEFIYSNQEFSQGNNRSFGFYSSLQNKLSARWWLSARAGYSELPHDPSQHEWDFTLAFDFWQSEFVLTRIQYQYNDRNIYGRRGLEGPFPSDHSFFIQVVWAMGPHKHEAY
jgi:TolA-binding protein